MMGDSYMYLHVCIYAVSSTVTEGDSAGVLRALMFALLLRLEHH